MVRTLRPYSPRKVQGDNKYTSTNYNHRAGYQVGYKMVSSGHPVLLFAESSNVGGLYTATPILGVHFPTTKCHYGDCTWTA